MDGNEERMSLKLYGRGFKRTGQHCGPWALLWFIDSKTAERFLRDVKIPENLKSRKRLSM